MSHTLVQLVTELVSIGSREQFRLQCLSEHHQRCWRTVSFWQAIQTEVPTAEKPPPTIVAWQVCDITKQWKTKSNVTDMCEQQKLTAVVLTGTGVLRYEGSGMW